MSRSQSTLPIEALRAFDVHGTGGKLIPLSGGLINQTWLWRCDSGPSFVLQRMNSAVFTDPDAVMANIARVTETLRADLRREGWSEHELQRRCLQFLPCGSGGLLHRDDSGDCWRLSHYIRESRCYDQLQSVAQVQAMASAFGHFQRRSAALDVQCLHETIVDFHHTPRRWLALNAAYQEDRCGRAASVRSEWEQFAQHQENYDCVEAAIAAGKIPWRVTHNDTKVSNLLFDLSGTEALCVMDLDTTMPGSVLYDFGDMVRSVVPNLPEDATDFRELDWQLDRYGALIRGFAQATRGWLIEEEIVRLPEVGGLITLELGMRFLTDYLHGDRYFSTHHPEHNLQRCRAQLRYFAGLQAAQPWARAEVERHFS